MTRTARKSVKGSLPATPWEELKQPFLEGLRKVKKNELKVTQKQRLGPNLSEKAKMKLKSVTGKKLKRSLSGNVRLLESDDLVRESTHEEVANGKTRENCKSKKHGEKGTMDAEHSMDVVRTAETNTPPKKYQKRGLVSSLKIHRSKKRRTVSEDRMPLLRSDSDGSLSDQVEGKPSGVSEGGSRDSEKDKLKGEVNGGESCEKKGVKSKTSTRIRVGKRWVKIVGSQSSTGQAVSGGDGTGGEEEGEEGAGATRKKKRGTDEERRKKRIEHRRLRRQRKKVCFSCRQPGHWVGECPLNSTSAGICFKCGSSEHSCQQCHVKIPSGEFPYAKCFICGEVGHLSRSCSDNPRGLYPKGGGCRVCGSVEHLRANCPLHKKSSSISANTTASGSTCSADAIASADEQDFTTGKPAIKKLRTGRRKEKVVKF